MALRTLSCLLVLAFLVPAALADLSHQVPAALAESTCLATDPCVANCTNCSPNEKVPDPEDCHRFYLCIDGTAPDNYYPLPFDCDEGAVFNFTIRDCVTGGSCEPCGPPPSLCVYECSTATTTNPVTFPSPLDCNSYYTCDDAGEVDGSLTCESETPFFDGEECQADKTKCCHCHPYCSTTDEPGIIADPLDCRGYYLCTAEDVGKVPTISGMCPDGEYFDSFIHDCSSTATCNTQCTNVVGADGCIDPFTCVETGYFAKCPLAENCTPEYYHCTVADGTFQEAGSCTDGTVFHPSSHDCVSGDSCP